MSAPGQLRFSSKLLRTAMKQAAAAAAHYSGIRRLLAMARRAASGGRRVLIIGYHRVVDDMAREIGHSIPSSLISTRTFRNQLEAVAKAGFEFASMSE